jgi:hypothetical protein
MPAGLLAEQSSVAHQTVIAVADRKPRKACWILLNQINLGREQ